MARDEPKVNIRLPQELKDKLHALALKNKRSVNAEVVSAIEKAVELLTDDEEFEILKQERDSVNNDFWKNAKITDGVHLDERLKRLDERLKRLDEIAERLEKLTQKPT
ncbi:Arc family DNA-binding protein [Citrobacter freundii]|uniref:Arc family DNA-binding protein n=1 Tax=Citrobacter freundii TaxID=546 RepID=UPI0028BECAFB|nr:Arc family DNA-binding protein [Citrobacter freundii]MDT7333638.1 Arc family DNA-binding protein [Citrobacter freundii]